MVTFKTVGRRISSLDLDSITDELDRASQTIVRRGGAGNEFLGWLDYASKIDSNLVQDIIETAERIRRDYDTLVLIGIGGSYLGARAVIEAIGGLYPSDSFRVVYLGETLSSQYTAQVLEWLRGRNFAVNVVSKSGTTTEPAVAFRLVKKLIEEKWGSREFSKRIIATTDRERGALRAEAEREGYKTFVIPDNIGGRFSVITPVGLLPIACAGIDIREFLRGVAEGEKDYGDPDWKQNPAYRYGAIRYLMEKEYGFTSEMFVTYEPQNHMIGEWLKQLFGESLGKEGKGLLPTSCVFTTDLHSMGQYVQQGKNCLFETIIKEGEPLFGSEIKIEGNPLNLDNLNYLSGKRLSYINDRAFEAVLKAHTDGQVDADVIEIERMDSYSLGNLIYFFFRAVSFCGYLMGINPFDQPGVELYKKNMFELLGKPGN